MRFWPKKKKPVVVEYFDIPYIRLEELREGDLSVSLLGGLTFSGASATTWTEIVYRPSTNELFRICCWDGTYSTSQHELPEGQLPEGVIIGSC